MFKPSAFQALDGSFYAEKLQSQYDNFKLLDKIQYNITVTNTGDAFLITGKAKVKAQTECSRCLDPVELNLLAKIDAYYLIEAPSDSEDEINEFEILPDDHNIPLGEIIKATLIVDAPPKPLCKEECKGLCQVCGKNLNKETCNCKEEADLSNPFSVLKDLKL